MSQDGNGDDKLAAMERLHRAAIRLLRSMRPLDAESGLSQPKLSVLSVLVFGGSATLSELAEAEQVRRPTMTQLVNTLETEGLVRKRPGSADRRQVHVEATERGRNLLMQGRARRLNVLTERLRSLSGKEQQALMGALEAFEHLAQDQSAGRK